ncbi:hypothetical protein [Nocardioides sp. TF02-7]|uniref:hypothetical protein n=1 Tax=Nocardioides sp. TF02-7 TaxID=2917724 RepID=UPI001F05B7EB|nr:hypothetical protein [Nocardioides sp. TF02-7]UMG94769.1 hypothetical protein MF408_10010 [Nocardioides sp. TF02-7]
MPGREVAGTVDLVGPGVEESWLGRRVVAHLGPVPGGYAEQAVCEVSLLFAVPDHVDLPAAVAAVGTGRTAVGVLELEPPAAGDVVLVPLRRRRARLAAGPGGARGGRRGRRRRPGAGADRSARRARRAAGRRLRRA